MKRARPNRAPRGRLQRWVLPALVALMAAAMLLVAGFVTRETQLEVGEPVYQYFLGQRTEFGEGAKVLLTKHNVVFSEDGQRTDGGTTPIYYRDRPALLLPARMSWSDPVAGGEWQIAALSLLEADDHGVIWCQDGDWRSRMSGGFLSDGAGTFVFLEGGTLEVDGQELELAPLSFCTLRQQELYVYRYDSQELLHEERLTENVRMKGPRYEADLTAGIYTAADGGKRLLAADPQALPKLGK